MAGTIVADVIQSDQSYPSSINIASPVIISNTFAFPAGTVSAPAFFPTGDTNTGIFFPAADTMAFAEGGTEAMRIDSSGNVGIGTSSPDQKLVIDGGASDTYLKVVGQSRNGFFGQDSVGLAIYQSASAPIYFLTSSTERARINSGGKILFNTTVQNVNEQVGMVYSSNAGVGFSIKDSNPQNGNTFIDFRNGATVAGTIQSNGTTTMNYGSASDYRLKSNPQPIQNALATVSALNPVSFTWNQTGEEGIGFIAHELQAVCPDAVAGEKDAVDENDNPKYQMIDAGSASLIATLTAAIQEQQAIIESLKSRLDAAGL